MKLHDYKNLNDFNENYLENYEKVKSEISLISFLKTTKKEITINLINQVFEWCYKINESYEITENDIHMFISKISYNDFLFSIIEKHGDGAYRTEEIKLFHPNDIFTILHNYCNSRYSNYYFDEHETLRLLKIIIDEHLNILYNKYDDEETFDDIIYLKCVIEKFIESEYINIIKSINDKINQEEKRLLINLPTQEIEHINPITEKEINKIRLLHKTGIIEFLLNKYKDSNPRSIARFFEKLTESPMLEKNNSSLFYTDKTNSKYPMKNLTLTQKQKLNLLMNEFGFVE